MYYNGRGNNNTASGFNALYYNGFGDNNTASGYQALYNNTTGSDNVAIGRQSGYGVLGFDFNQCTFVGANSYPTVARTNVTMLGYGITNGENTGDNQVLLGNTAITQIRAQVGSITTYSDARMKFNVKEDIKGLPFVLKLRPVTYNQNPEILHQIWGTPDSLLSKIDHSDIKKKRFIGFLAQEVEQAMNETGFEFPGIEKPENNNGVYSLRYGDFIPVLVKAIQDQQEIIEQQKLTIKDLHSIIQRQQQQIDEILKRLEAVEKQ